ncbi:MAG TPA: MaoC family dehydratase [Bacteroidia bacterium]|jgi:enoyl-CoA hydratase|nr:MaoC family dehydratase [Bacteroidia bacterium]
MTYKVGDKATVKKVFTTEEVELFAILSTDKNPVHLDDAYSATTIFKKRIVHGSLVSSLISSVLGNTLPGNGSIYLSQMVNFKKPVFLNDEVTCTVEIMEIIPEKSIYKLNTNCYNASNEMVIEGNAVIKLMRNN